MQAQGAGEEEEQQLPVSSPPRRWFTYKLTNDDELLPLIPKRQSWLGTVGRRQSWLGAQERLQRVSRTLSFLTFYAVSATAALAGTWLGLLETCAALAVYLAFPHGDVATAVHDYDVLVSPLDLLALSCLRGVASAGAYLAGARLLHRPYLWVSIFFAAFGLPLSLLKLPRARRTAELTLTLALFNVFSLFALSAAAYAGHRAQMRSNLGLQGFGFAWREEEARRRLLNQAHLTDEIAGVVRGGRQAEQTAPLEV